MESGGDHLDFLDDLVNLPESYYGFIYHYYRAEVYRETNWRNRLDTTTNWSIIVTAAMLSFVFSDKTAPHSVILVNYFLVWFFLYIESRRFRYYWLLRERTRIIEKQLLSKIFSGMKGKLDENKWKENLGESFKELSVPMSRVEAVAWRLRRNYFFMMPVLFISWLAKVQSFPYETGLKGNFFENARVWFVPGFWVFTLFFLSIVVALVLAFYIPNKAKHSDLP